jgi:hypothetical protein
MDLNKNKIKDKSRPKNKKMEDHLKKNKKWKTSSTIKKSTLNGCDIIIN